MGSTRFLVLVGGYCQGYSTRECGPMLCLSGQVAREEPVIPFARYVTAGLAVFVGSLAAHAQVSDNVVKIGILNDQSGVYADFGGKWSVEAARLAVGDFGGKVLGGFKWSSQHGLC